MIPRPLGRGGSFFRYLFAGEIIVTLTREIKKSFEEIHRFGTPWTREQANRVLEELSQIIETNPQTLCDEWRSLYYATLRLGVPLPRKNKRWTRGMVEAGIRQRVEQGKDIYPSALCADGVDMLYWKAKDFEIPLPSRRIKRRFSKPFETLVRQEGFKDQSCSLPSASFPVLQSKKVRICPGVNPDIDTLSCDEEVLIEPAFFDPDYGWLLRFRQKDYNGLFKVDPDTLTIKKIFGESVDLQSFRDYLSGKRNIHGEKTKPRKIRLFSHQTNYESYVSIGSRARLHLPRLGIRTEVEIIPKESDGEYVFYVFQADSLQLLGVYEMNPKLFGMFKRAPFKAEHREDVLIIDLNLRSGLHHRTLFGGIAAH